jgi:hypothetical protein
MPIANIPIGFAAPWRDAIAALEADPDAALPE